MPTAPAAAELKALQASIDGHVVTSDMPDYESARATAVPRPDEVRPLAVVACTAAEDVAEALTLARRLGVRVAPRSGGHCFAGRSTTRGIVLDVTPLDRVDVLGDVDGDIAVVGAGVRLAALYDVLDARGLTVPAGCGPTVGIAGLTLGGGIGVLGRRHGLACDRLVAATLVLAEGRVVHCDADHHPDLLWGLRGAGGGQFGIVTSLMLRTVPAPETTAFHLQWHARHAARVVAVWQRWAPDAPDHVDATLRFTAPADLEEPCSVRLVGAVHADPGEAVALIERFVQHVGLGPDAVTTKHGGYRTAKAWLADLGDPHDVHAHGTDATFPVATSELFGRDLPPDVVTTLLDHLSERRVGGQARDLSFTPLGGAYNRVRVDATAFAHRTERFMLEHSASAPRSGLGAARAWSRRSRAIAHTVGSGRVYPNFPDPQLPGAVHAYHGENLARLRHVKRRYDPDRVFRFHQSL